MECWWYGVAVLCVVTWLGATATDALCMRQGKNDELQVLTEPFGYFWTQDELTGYSSDSYCNVLLAPQWDGGNITGIHIDIFFVETEACCDHGTIYAGENSAAPLVLTVSGRQTANVTVPGPTAFFNFDSDGTVDRDGIAAFYRIVELDESDIDWDAIPCLFDCYGRGECVAGKCQCYDGYTGPLCKNEDQAKLFQIYDNCRGADWVNPWSRNHDRTLCQAAGTYYVSDPGWPGVTCYSSRVTNIDLRGFGLNCTGHGLPQDTFPRYTETVDLTGELITGSLPSQIFRTAYLTQLLMSGTRLEGSIPEDVSRAATLNTLVLHNNWLTGRLPASLTRLTQLVELNLENNNLLGFISEDFAYLDRAVILLANNSFTCPVPEIPRILSSTCANVTITGAKPSSAYSTGGQSITVYGSNFRSDSEMACMFGEIVSPHTVVLDSQTMHCITPSKVPGKTELQVSEFGRPSAVNPWLFEITNYCARGTFLARNDSTVCVPCPVGAVCDGGVEPPYPQESWHESLKMQDLFLPCFLSSACPSNKNGSCAPGFTGSRCSECLPGLMLAENRCVKCGDGSKHWTAFIMLGALILAAIYLVAMVRTEMNVCSVSLVLCLLQTSSLVLRIPLNWPSTLNPLLRVFSGAGIAYTSVNISCVFRLSFQHWIYVLISFPYMFLAIVAPVSTAWTFWVKRSARCRRERVVENGAVEEIEGCVWETVRRIRDTTVNAFLAAMMIGHIPLAEQFVSVFQCATDVDRSYMLANPQITCYTPQWNKLKLAAIFGCTLYAAGIPVLVFMLSLRTHRHVNEPYVLERYSILYQLYNEPCWWFEAYRKTQGVILMIIPVILADYPLMIAVLSMVSINIDKLMVMAYQPYRFPHANKLYNLIILALNGILISGILFYSKILTRAQIVGISAALYFLLGCTLCATGHSMIYEFQAVHYERIISYPLWSRLVRSKFYQFFFPYHLSPLGKHEAVAGRRLPALPQRPLFDCYPEHLYEHIADKGKEPATK
ncbi:hypothetical protein DFS34DRAFT_63300 [Phlyctochytrium arcticum]|nr:hypothetical protein DFS34DRAFT_63300 [Phlyctochytrium arcticum]